MTSDESKKVGHTVPVCQDASRRRRRPYPGVGTRAHTEAAVSGIDGGGRLNGIKLNQNVVSGKQ